MRVYLNSKFLHYHDLLLNSAFLGDLVDHILAGARGVGGNVHFPIPFKYSLNLKEPAICLILSLCAFFRNSVFLSILPQLLAAAEIVAWYI
jgi:hypothetical protein